LIGCHRHQLLGFYHPGFSTSLGSAAKPLVAVQLQATTYSD
jgi:hypothetical protein